MNAEKTLDQYLRARYPVIAVLSHEERRVLSAISDVAANRKMAVAVWSLTSGWKNLPGVDADQTRDPAGALDAILTYCKPDAKPTAFIMLDVHNVLGTGGRFDPMLTRYIRDVAARFETERHSLILLGPSLEIPGDLEKTVAVIDWPLPGQDSLAAILAKAEADLPASMPRTLNGNRDTVVQALQGLTEFEATSVLLAGVVASGELGDSIIAHIVGEKAQIIKKSGVLEYYDSQVTMQDVGGLGKLKAYAARKQAAFTSTARAAGVECPKGALLVGVPGTGKSLSAKAIAGQFRMPLLRMDIGALMGGLVGQSEGNMRTALKVAEAVAPCVLWIDEIEKALGGSSGEHDGGTSQRVFGTLLTWMQETSAPVYVIATANNVASLQPELISRFDDVFFVDLPAQVDRVEIVRVHLRKRKQDPAAFDLPAIATKLYGYSGREIERVIKTAIEAAYCDGQPLTDGYIMAAAGETVPVTVTMREKIDGLRAWVKAHQARYAADPLEPQPEQPAKTGRVLMD